MGSGSGRLEARTVKAATYARYGDPRVLEVGDVPRPVPRDHEVLVRVRAASVNPVDWKIRAGRLRPVIRASFPRIPGCDVAGEVVEAGAQVSRFTPGEEVFAMLSPRTGGATAEFAAVAERSTARKPSNLSWAEAAAVPLAALTALQGLRDQGDLEGGDRVLVHGASGGVGHFAVQLGKVLGGHVTAVAGSGRQDFLRELGADETVDYTREDFLDRGERWDVILDVVANRSFRRCRDALTSRGRYVRLLPSPSAVVSGLATHVLGWIGYGRRSKTVMVRARGTDLTYLAGLIEQGKLKPVVREVFGLDDVRAAHEASETGHARGKVVVELP